MEVMFEARSLEALGLREIVVQRTRLAMRRLSGMALSARVQLDDINGPRGGLDKRCFIEVWPAGGRPVVVKTTALRWREAVEAALERVVRALLRATQRRKQRARNPPRRLMAAR